MAPEETKEFNEWMKKNRWRQTTNYFRSLGTDSDGTPEFEYKGIDELKRDFESEKRMAKRFPRK